MKFAHHRKHRLPVEQQAAAVHGNFMPGGIARRAEFKIAAPGGRRSLHRRRNQTGAERKGKRQADREHGAQQLGETGIHSLQITRPAEIWNKKSATIFGDIATLHFWTVPAERSAAIQPCHTTRASPLPFTMSPMIQAWCFCARMKFSAASALS